MWLRHGAVVYCKGHRTSLSPNVQGKEIVIQTAHKPGKWMAVWFLDPTFWLRRDHVRRLTCPVLTQPPCNPQLCTVSAPVLVEMHLPSVLPSPGFYHGFHQWRRARKNSLLQTPQSPRCHRSSVPKAGLTLMLLGSIWEPSRQPATWLLMQTREVAVPQAICGHIGILHMAPHRSLQRMCKED